jgi:hypothetical protein
MIRPNGVFREQHNSAVSNSKQRMIQPNVVFREQRNAAA